MCGIFGLALQDRKALPANLAAATVKKLAVLSQSRGKEASGLATSSNGTINVLKSIGPASELVKSRECRQLLTDATAAAADEPVAIIGHSRLVTTGTLYSADNNQPVVSESTVGIHNGIVVNHDELWPRFPAIKRHYQVDTEIILALIRSFHAKHGCLAEATRLTFAQIEGSASIAVLFADLDVLILATNNGSLYTSGDATGNITVFASEENILRRLLNWRDLRGGPLDRPIKHVMAGQGICVDLATGKVDMFPLAPDATSSQVTAKPRQSARSIYVRSVDPIDHGTRSAYEGVGSTGAPSAERMRTLEAVKKRFPHDSSWQDSLRRCTRCVLPATMPFIEFDEDGVCNFCHNYAPRTFRPEAELREIVDRHRRADDRPDCVVGISGGRDSLYSLHYVKTVLKMNPIAYTYDWGMVTDLARRNISRICATLGVEHLLVSANIPRKRAFIRKNVTAWLRKPDLGMIPLFMAGDKQYFYYLYKVKKQVGLELAILGENMLERTDFKTGFANVKPYNRDTKHAYTLPLADRARVALYYIGSCIRNPAYINISLLDSAFAFGSYYIIERAYTNLYNYVRWAEDVVVPTLINQYNFELAEDTVSSWRIGDGTAAFYNYIYYTVAGFSENDTFRSNQVREGIITRDEALQRIAMENRPRYESIQWYLMTIGLDDKMERVFDTINNTPRLKPAASEDTTT